MKEIELWSFAHLKCNQGLQVKLVIVADSNLSSPGRPGFKMIVSEDMQTCGTIGGGIMEYDILQEIEDSFSKSKSLNIIRKLYHSKTKEGNKSGQICGGSQTVIIATLSYEDCNKIKNIVSNIKHQVNGVLTLNPNAILYKNKKENYRDIILTHQSDIEWSYEENLGQLNTIYIIGGGHVGLAISKVFSLLDVYIKIFDNRDDVFTMKNNTFANAKVITDYSGVNKHIKEGRKSYAVIVTSNHDGDRDALKSIIEMDLKYIGMMGSSKKSKSIFSSLSEMGVNKNLFPKVNTPIGIEIEAESPEEIAISISAEIIKQMKSNK